jgi:hypothetical protein
MSRDGQTQIAASESGAVKSITDGINWETFQVPGWGGYTIKGVGISGDGGVMAVVNELAGFPGPNVYWLIISLDGFATSHTALSVSTASNRFFWNPIAMSHDGQYVYVAMSGDGRIYVSSNYGAAASFGNTFPQTNVWRDIATSYDGKYVTAVGVWCSTAFGPGPFSGIWISSNYGASWTQAVVGTQGSPEPLYIGATSAGFTGISMDDSGQFQTATRKGGYVVCSCDYGQTWQTVDSPRGWTCIGTDGPAWQRIAGTWGEAIYKCDIRDLNYSSSSSIDSSSSSSS